MSRGPENEQVALSLLTAALRARLSEVDGESAQWAVYQIDMLAGLSTR